jgi:hypothetical protein
VALAGAIAALVNPVTLVVAAVAGLAVAWTQNWGDIQGKTQQALDLLQPYWQSLQTTLSEFAEQALPKLKEIWQTLVDFWNNSLGPVVSDLSGRFDAAAGVANVLALALGYLKAGLDILLFVLDGVSLAATVWTTNVSLALDVLNSFIAGVDILVGSLTTLWDWINKVVEAFQEDGLRGALKELKDALPDWMVPGSPTPLEMGIRGISDAINKLPDLGKAFQVPDLAAVAAGGAGTPLPALPTVGGGTVSNVFAPTIQIYPAGGGNGDYSGLVKQVEQTVLDLLTKFAEGKA